MEGSSFFGFPRGSASLSLETAEQYIEQRWRTKEEAFEAREAGMDLRLEFSAVIEAGLAHLHRWDK